MVETLQKKRYNFTLTCRAKSRLEEMSNKSTYFLGRHTSMSEIIEILIDRAFIDRKELIEKQITELELKLSSLNEEWTALNNKERNLNLNTDIKNKIIA